MFIFKWTFLSFVPICTTRIYRIHNQFFITARSFDSLLARKHRFAVTVNRHHWAVSLTMTLFDLSSSKSECATINMRVPHLVWLNRKNAVKSKWATKAGNQTKFTCHHLCVSGHKSNSWTINMQIMRNHSMELTTIQSHPWEFKILLSEYARTI